MNLKMAKEKIEVILEGKKVVNAIDKMLGIWFNFDGGYVFNSLKCHEIMVSRMTDHNPQGRKELYDTIYSNSEKSIEEIMGIVIERHCFDDLLKCDPYFQLKMLNSVESSLDALIASKEFKDMTEKVYDLLDYRKYHEFYDAAINGAITKFNLKHRDAFEKICMGRPLSYSDGTGTKIGRDLCTVDMLKDFIKDWSEALDEAKIDDYEFLLEWEQKKDD